MTEWRAVVHLAARVSPLTHKIEDHCTVLISPESAMPIYSMIMQAFLGRVSLRLTSRTRK